MPLDFRFKLDIVPCVRVGKEVSLVKLSMLWRRCLVPCTASLDH
jgi:hypothetical protein